MENVKETIAANLVSLRKANKMTQSTLAEKLNYSDKAISRWEHAETLPDIETLCRICEIYGVSFEYLLRKDQKDVPVMHNKKINRARRVIICLLSVCTVWLAATILFAFVKTLTDAILWQIFVWAVPSSIIAITICNHMWWKSKVCASITASFINWAVIFATYLNLYKHNLWQLFLVGIPIQAIIMLAITIPEKKL